MGIFDSIDDDLQPDEFTDIDYRDVRAYENYSDITCFDNTMHNTYRICPRKYYWSIVRGFEPAKKSSPLIFGSAWHLFLEHYLKGVPIDAALVQPIRDLATSGITDSKRNPSVLMDLATKYDAQFGAADYKVIDTELFGAILIGDFIYGAKIDAVVEDRDKIKGMEHKTASRMGYGYFDMWRMASQTRGYFSVLKALNANASDLIINVAHIVKTPEFFREPLRWTKPQMIDWETTQINTNHQIKTDFKTEIWEQRTESCLGKYGPCPFLSLCMEPCDYKEVIPLHSEYVPRKWEPFHNEMKGGSNAK